MMNNLQNFKVLPLRFSASSTTSHDVYMKENSLKVSDESKPAGKTLFVLNIPPYANESSLKKIFSKAGKVKNIILQHNDSEKGEHQNCGFMNGYIIFNKREGLLKALKLEGLDPLSAEKDPIETGMRKWVKEYNDSILDHDKLSDEVEKYMAQYDRKEAEEKAKEKETDDDGWTIVTKKGRNPGLSKAKSKKFAKMKSKKKELKNFYSFQIREQKMKMVEELRKKYEADKVKVESMRKLRKFKPY